jgi:hypothetical protein
MFDDTREGGRRIVPEWLIIMAIGSPVLAGLCALITSDILRG